MPWMVNLKMTPTNGGDEVKLENVQGFEWGSVRPPDQNGRLGMHGHMVKELTFQREIRLPEGEDVTLNGSTIKAAAASGSKAYYQGEVTLVPPDTPETPIRTWRFGQGHVCDHHEEYRGDRIFETFSVAVTSLTVDESEFRRPVG